MAARENKTIPIKEIRVSRIRRKMVPKKHVKGRRDIERHPRVTAFRRVSFINDERTDTSDTVSIKSSFHSTS